MIINECSTLTKAQKQFLSYLDDEEYPIDIEMMQIKLLLTRRTLLSQFIIPLYEMDQVLYNSRTGLCCSFTSALSALLDVMANLGDEATYRGIYLDMTRWRDFIPEIIKLAKRKKLIKEIKHPSVKRKKVFVVSTVEE